MAIYNRFLDRLTIIGRPAGVPPSEVTEVLIQYADPELRGKPPEWLPIYVLKADMGVAEIMERAHVAPEVAKQ